VAGDCLSPTHVSHQRRLNCKKLSSNMNGMRRRKKLLHLNFPNHETFSLTAQEDHEITHQSHTISTSRVVLLTPEFEELVSQVTVMSGHSKVEGSILDVEEGSRANAINMVENVQANLRMVGSSHHIQTCIKSIKALPHVFIPASHITAGTPLRMMETLQTLGLSLHTEKE
jgi:hypothetical protein